MPLAQTLLYLHGVGEGDAGDGWREVLERSLTAIGYPGLEGIEVIAPKYPNGLRGVDDDVPVPKLSVKALRGDAAEVHRRDFERRRTAMEVLLGGDDESEGLPGGGAAVAVARRFVEQAKNYVESPKIRGWVLQRVLDRLPTSGRVVIVGHSLGSVIAADLLRRLPAEVEVTGMVTIGSPLGHSTFNVDRLVETLVEPPSNLAWWVNCWNAKDPVPARRGVSAVLPWVLDRRIKVPVSLNPVHGHAAAVYLENPTVAEAIGRGLFGSRSMELAVVEHGLELALDEVESWAVLALRYAHLTLQQLEGDTAARFAEALRQMQAATVQQIADRNRGLGRPLPRTVAELAVDLSDPESKPVMPALPAHLSKAEAVVPLMSLASTNLVRPFEIEVSEWKRQLALQELTFEMKLGRRFGKRVFEAMETARDELKGPTNWVKWTALGLGAAALVAVTSGLALAAAPGAVGAAAMTSALATFGPGGMLGGLVTAGALASAGGGGIAIGLAAPGASAEAVEAVLATQLAGAILRKNQGLPPDPNLWNTLIEVEREIRREHTRLKSVSDDSAPGVATLQRKLDAIGRALAYLEANGLHGREPLALEP